jgi:L-arabonate dehydrase
MPSGRFLMEDFYYAGGLPAVLRRLGEAGRCRTPMRSPPTARACGTT